MEKSKERFNIWNYLPTLKEAKWWILIGIIYHSFTMLCLASEYARESILGLGGLPRWLEYISPVFWVQGLLFSVFGPIYPPIGEMWVYGAFLSGLTGYLLRTIFKLITKR